MPTAATETLACDNAKNVRETLSHTGVRGATEHNAELGITFRYSPNPMFTKRYKLWKIWNTLWTSKRIARSNENC